MFSGQWEVVGKSKRDKGATTKLTKAAKKKMIENAPKVEDILPLAQVKSLYSALNNNKENKKPKEKVKEPAPPKKQPQKQSESKAEPAKPKPPKNIEIGLNSINPTEMKALFELGKQRFPEAPLIWLKDLATFINSRTNVESIDATFSNKPAGYPLSAVPEKVRSVMESALNVAGRKNSQLFFDVCLSSMSNDLSKGAPVVGYKIFVQLLVFNNPSIVLVNLPKSIAVRNSYQNRQVIGLSLLWCLGQAATKSFDIGLRIFQEVMMSMIEMKNYSRYIIGYLKALLVHPWDAGTLSHENYLYIYDIVNGVVKVNIPRDIMKELTAINAPLRAQLFDGRKDGKYHLLFETLLKRLQQNNYANNIKADLMGVLLQCFILEPQCFNVWKQLYPKNIAVSAALLTNIKNKWSAINATVDKKQFKVLMTSFEKTNTSLKQSKRKEEALAEASKSCKVLLEKMTVSRSLPWKSGIFVVLLAIGGLVVYDANQHGSFEKSSTGRFLRDSGLWDHGQVAIKHGVIYTKQAVAWLNENGPVYYASTKEFLTPYGHLARDLMLISANVYTDLKEYAIQQTPVVLKTVDSYAPGLVDTVYDYSQVACNFVCNYFHMLKDFLITKVFVGQLSPDNLQKVTLEAINTTQLYATQYYDWLYQKMQMLSDIK